MTGGKLHKNLKMGEPSSPHMGRYCDEKVRAAKVRHAAAGEITPHCDNVRWQGASGLSRDPTVVPRVASVGAGGFPAGHATGRSALSALWPGSPPSGGHHIARLARMLKTATQAGDPGRVRSRPCSSMLGTLLAAEL